MINKVCNKCDETKSIFRFSKNGNHPNGDIRYRSFCKDCIIIISKEYRKTKVEHQREYSKQYYLRTKETRKQKRESFTKKWYEKNKERCCCNAKNWRKNNPEKIKQIEDRHAAKRLSTIKGKLSNHMANAIRRKIKGIKLRKHWENIVGYSYLELRNHLESLFRDGMSWQNYGQWHIDHIIPISFFDYKSFNDVEFKMCWRLENLQPMWAKENIRKRNKILKLVS